MSRSRRHRGADRDRDDSERKWRKRWRHRRDDEPYVGNPPFAYPDFDAFPDDIEVDSFLDDKRDQEEHKDEEEREKA